MANLGVKYGRYLEGTTWFLRTQVSPQARRFREALPSGSAILDVGCGSGADAAYLAERHAVVACDVRPQAAAVLANVHKLPFCQGLFDGVFCRGVLHLTDSDVAVGELRRVAKEGALLFMSYPLDVFDDDESSALANEVDASVWGMVIHRRVSQVDHGDHRHNMLQLWLQKTEAK